MIERRSLSPVLVISFLIFLAFLSFKIEILFKDPKLQTHPKDPLYRLIGSVKEVFGDTVFMKADSYFHGGVNTELLKEYREHAHESGAHRDDEEDERAFKRTFTDWIYRINSRIKITEHKHLKGDESKEILPFLILSVKLDPYNIPAILTTAHWIDKNFNKTDEAINLLKEGAQNNPESWEIFYQLGLVYFQRKNDVKNCIHSLEEALGLMDDKVASGIDRRLAWYTLGEAYSKENSNKKALAAYKKALELFSADENLPLRSIIFQKIQSLSSDQA